MAEEYSALPPEAPPQVPGFEAPGYAGGFSLNPTEQDINRLYPVAPEPDIPIPQYISSVPPYSAAEVPPPEDYLRRPNYENMFSVVYQPTVASNPVVGWIARGDCRKRYCHQRPCWQCPRDVQTCRPTKTCTFG